MEFKSLKISVPGNGEVSALWHMPQGAKFLYIFGHGAGAGMNYPLMTALATALGHAGIGTLRYQFPYMEAGKKMPNRHPVLEATVIAAIKKGQSLAPKARIVIGGRSMGGRMSSQALAHADDETRDSVVALIYLGFPLHKIDEPSVERADHLAEIRTPMLFVQGTEDEMCEPKLLKSVVSKLKSKCKMTIHWLEGADHGFKVKGGAKAQQALFDQIGKECAAWLQSLK